MRPDEFWELSLYDWSIYLLRVRHIQDLRKAHFEHRNIATAELMALIANVNRDQKKHPEPFTRDDFLGNKKQPEVAKAEDLELYMKEFDKKPLKNGRERSGKISD